MASSFSNKNTNGTTRQVEGSHEAEMKIVKKVNKKLAAGKKRKGMIILKSLLLNCSDGAFSENCVKWMQHCCIIDETDISSATINLQVLRELTKTAVKYPELGKSISNSVISRFTDIFLKHLVNCEEGWQTLETLLWSYNGPFGPNKDTLTALMKRRLKSEKLKMAEAKCYALLPSVGGGGSKGVTHKANWTAQFTSLISQTHATLNFLFKDILELQVYDVESPIGKDVSYEDAVLRLRNHCLVLRAMLLGRYPVSKNIFPEKVLELVSRSLLVTGTFLGDAELATTVTLRTAVPTIHSNLLQVLSALIVSCSRALLPCASVVIGLIKQTLTSSSSAEVRINCFSCLINWLAIAETGSCTDAIARVLVPAVLGDINYFEPAICLGGTKKITKDLGWNNDTGADSKELVCFAALETLQTYLLSIGFLIPPDIHKTIQEAVIRLLTTLHRCCDYDVPIYGNSERCRRGLYSVLLQLCLEPCSRWPPPTQFASKFFSLGKDDPSPIVSTTCSVALSVLDRIIHPEFKVAAFPVDYQKVLESESNESDQVTYRLQPEQAIPKASAFFRQFFEQPTIPTVHQRLNKSRTPSKSTVDKQSSYGSPGNEGGETPNTEDLMEVIVVQSNKTSEVPNDNKLIENVNVESAVSIGGTPENNLIENENSERERDGEEIMAVSNSGDYYNGRTVAAGPNLTDRNEEVGDRNTSTCSEDGKSSDIEITELTVVETAPPAKKQKLSLDPHETEVKNGQSPSQESVASDVSSLPCSQYPVRIGISADGSSLCSQDVLTQKHVVSPKSPISSSGFQQKNSQEELPDSDIEILTPRSNSTSSSVESQSLPCSQVDKLKANKAERCSTPERKYNLRNKVNDSPMILRSGVALPSPIVSLERKPRRRAGSISSLTSQSSRCHGAPGSPRSEIGDVDSDILEVFHDDLQGDD